MFEYNTKVLMVKLYSGGYVKEYGIDYAHEKLNLENNKGKYYGLVPGWNDAGELKCVAIEKIDKSAKNSKYIDDVLVVYVQKTTGSNVEIVAYGKNSIVYRNPQSGKGLNRIMEDPVNLQLNCVDYHIVTNANDMRTKFKYSLIIDYNKYEKLYNMFRSQRSYLDNPSDMTKISDYQKLKKQIIDYINNCENDCEDEILHEELETIPVDPNDLKKGSGSCFQKMKTQSTSNGGVLKKSAKVSKLALELSNYECEFDKNHTTFITQTGKQYMEGHHLIRCTQTIADKMWDKYNRSIDDENNIVSLCPICHRRIHYGNQKEKEEIIKKLYDQQIEKLRSIEIDITLDELYKIYDL